LRRPTGISLPMLNTSLGRFPSYAQWAEQAGFGSVWTYELSRSPFMAMAAAASRTSTIQVGSAVASAFSRSPWRLANTAADLQEVSNGRTILGIGTGSPKFLTDFHGLAAPERPVAQLTEYIDCFRACWQYLQGDDPEPFVGQTYSFTPPLGFPWRRAGTVPVCPPVYVGGVRPRMIRTAATCADGLVGYLMSPEYLRQVVLPNVAAGAARVGNDPSDLDVVALTICSVSRDRSEAWRRARIHVGMYLAASSAGEVLARFHGFEQQRETIRAALREKGPGILEHTTGDELVEALAIVGTPDECRRRLTTYQELVPTVVLHTPYVAPLSADESEDAFRSIVELLGPAPPVGGVTG